MYLHQDDGPTEYPLAMSGLGLPSGNTAAGNVRSGDPAPDQSWSQWLWDAVAPTSPLLTMLPSFTTTAVNPNTPAAPVQSIQAPPQAKIDPRIATLWKRVGDLDSFGLLSATEKNVISDYIRNGKIQQAEEIVSEKENNAGNAKKRPSIFSSVDQFLPIGYKIQDQLIPNVPNYVLYGGVLVLGVITAKKAMRK